MNTRVSRLTLIALTWVAALSATGLSAAEPARAANRVQPIAGHAQDEPMGGRTLRGSPVTPRTVECFPAERRDLFWQMDAVASGPGGALEPLNFDIDGDGKISDKERQAIQGRNTWLLWAAGNEAFWGWLQENGYGLVDFLILLDSRERSKRFETAGIINQPGMASNRDPSKKLLGLYLDQPATTSAPLPEWLAKYSPTSVGPAQANAYGAPGPIWMTQPGNDVDAKTGALAKREGPPAGHPQELFPTKGAKVPVWNADGTVKKNPDGTEAQEDLENFVRKIASELPKDGVDYSVYGYPSGVVGLRLFLNPDFFSNTADADRARRYWFDRVVRTNDRYYTDPSINGDPSLVRPFRVGMSCGFCHVGPHPLSPPKDLNEPQWHNLSSIIGAQYWKPQSAFGNLLKRNSFLFHFLNSQQPGTIDTSLVSTDQINNANTINAVFDIPARLARAAENPPEQQSAANLRVKSIEEGQQDKNPRHTPRVLLDGSDSIGAFGALARVYLNIGTFWEEWKTRHNAIIGFRPQKPFELEVAQHNSVYWQTNELYRTDYLAAFFTLKHAAIAAPASAPASYGAQNATGPMKLRDAKEPDGMTASAAAQAEKGHATKEQRIAGRKVWLENCALCHSSKQPAGFALNFKADWNGAAPAPDAPAVYTLPLEWDLKTWDAFKASPAYKDYVARLYRRVEADVAEARQQWEKAGRHGPEPVADLETDPWERDHPFWADNYLSTDIRVPISLIGTNSGRSMATNGLKGEIWDNFSSETYKALPAAGKIRFYNPFATGTSALGVDGTNAEFQPKGEGRGYYRPASHIALWATGPYLHNNTVGVFNADPSVRGRLAAYHDGMQRMLWFSKRANPHLLDHEGKADASQIVAHPGDLRPSGSAASQRDPGYIYRLPLDTHITFGPQFIRPIVEGVLGSFLTPVLTVWLWVFLFLLFVAAAISGRPRHAGIIFVFLAILAVLGIAYSGMGGMGGTTVGVLLMGIGNLLEFSALSWWILAVLLGAIGLTLIFARQDNHSLARWLIVAMGLAAAIALGWFRGSWMLAAGAVIVTALLAWWSRRWTLTQFARILFAAIAVATVAVGWTANRFINGKVILHVPVANVNVGPLPIDVGPIPRGTPVNLLMNLDPESKQLPKAVASMFIALSEIKKQGLTNEAAWKVLSDRAGADLLRASKCPDFVLDRGHGFAESLDDAQKQALIAFLETL